MNPGVDHWISRWVATWLVFWGLCGCMALGCAMLLAIPGNTVFGRALMNSGALAVAIAVIAIPASFCLWDGFLFWTRQTFSGLGQAVSFLNTVSWGLLTAFVILGTPVRISAFSVALMRASCIVLYLAHLGSLTWVWVSRRRLKRLESP